MFCWNSRRVVGTW